MNKSEEQLKKLVKDRCEIYEIYEKSWDSAVGEFGEYIIEEPKEIDELANKIRKLIKQKRDEISCEAIIESLTHLGGAPQMLYDDNGHFAITGDGFSPVPMSDSGKFEDDETFNIFVKPEMWKDTIREALYFYLDVD